MRSLFPVCRSITGNGVRQTLDVLSAHIPLERREVPTGTRVYDWTVPKEWNIRDAYVRRPGGPRLIDFRASNLHVLNYSVPVERTVSLAELKEHLFTLPEHPDWVPYKTSYYSETWGFCISESTLRSFEEGDYEVRIDSTLSNGHLTYGECFLPGESADEVLISTHVCHPSLANDNLSGICTATLLARQLARKKRRYSYRFLFVPGIIGSITWLSFNIGTVSRIRHGMVLAGVGDGGPFTYKKSRRGDTEIDRLVPHVLASRNRPYSVRDFSPYGYDERQYCSPGFDLPVGGLSRTPYAEYPQYHTSADNLGFVTEETLAESYSVIAEICETLEANRTYRNLNPMGEPQLGRRGLYDGFGPGQLAMLWVLSLTDGHATLLDISVRSGLAFPSVRDAAAVLVRAGLLAPA